MPLNFVDYRYVESDVEFSVTGASYVPDPEAEISISTDKEYVVFILCQVISYDGVEGSGIDKIYRITIDGAEVTLITTLSPTGTSNEASSGVIAYVGLLPAGSHTIRGELRAVNVGYTVVISYRRLLVILFDGSPDDFLMTSMDFYPSAIPPSYPPEVSFTVPPAGKRGVPTLIIFQGNVDASGSEIARIGIEIDGITDALFDVCRAGINTVFLHLIKVLESNSSHTITLSYEHVHGAYHSYLIIMFLQPLQDFRHLFDDTDQDVSGLTNDNVASITFETLYDGFLLVMYTADMFKEGTNIRVSTAISIDGTDCPETRKELRQYGCATSFTFISLASGTHTIAGRVACTLNGPATLDKRYLTVILFANFKLLRGTVKLPNGTPVANARVVIINEDTDEWKDTVFTDSNGSFSCYVPPNLKWTVASYSPDPTYGGGIKTHITS